MQSAQEKLAFSAHEIKAIIGLGNPGSRFTFTRHNIGFLVVDALAEQLGVAQWQSQENMLYAQVQGKILIKPQTFMNNSGKVLSFLIKKGIKAEHILVIHDELEKPFGHLSFRFGGSARGHNGLRSIMEVIGADYWRLRFGIARPENKEDVGDYVLTSFSPQEKQELEGLIAKAVSLIEPGQKANNKQ